MGDLLSGTPWWVWLFFLIGVVATIGVGITLFSTVGRRPTALEGTARPGVAEPGFLETLAGTLNLPVESGGSAKLLNDGDEFFPAVLDAIRHARHHIHFMVYIWKEGRAADMVLDALIERARAGIEVRVLLDGLGAFDGPDERFEDLRRAGGTVARYRPLRFGKLTRFHKRNHRRAIVIDGRIGFTGGVSVQDCWLGHAQDPEHWRDIMVRLEGPSARGLQAAFTELWAYTCGEIVVGDAYYLHAGESGDAPAAERVPDANPDSGTQAPTAADERRCVTLVSSPADEEHPVRLFFSLSFMAARRELLIATPYFAPDEAAREILCERAQAGVDVRLLVPGEHIDVPLVRWAARSHYARLLERGVRVYEYQPTLIHMKAVVVDGLWCVVGSANLDVRSKELNNEVMCGIADRELAGALRSSFMRDLERAHEIRQDEWARRGLADRLRERLARPVAEQF